MMFSPALSPVRTIRFPSTAPPSWTGRYSTVFVGLTVSTNRWFWSVPIAVSSISNKGCAALPGTLTRE